MSDSVTCAISLFVCLFVCLNSCEDAFNYVHKRAKQHENHIHEKEFVWDLSFPQCTPQLRMYFTLHNCNPLTHTHISFVVTLLCVCVCLYIDAAVTEWIRDNFRNPYRPKCLILIGPTGTGKMRRRRRRSIIMQFNHCNNFIFVLIFLLFQKYVIRQNFVCTVITRPSLLFQRSMEFKYLE